MCLRLCRVTQCYLFSGCDDIDFETVDFAEDDIAAFDGGIKAHGAEFFEQCGDFGKRHRRGAFDGDAAVFIVVDENGGSHNAARIGKFSFCVFDTARTAVAADIYTAAAGSYFQMTACGTVYTDFIDFFHFQHSFRLTLTLSVLIAGSSKVIISGGLT